MAALPAASRPGTARPAAPRSRRHNDQGGFVITVELILVMTILGIGLLIGIIAIRDALFKYYVKQQSQQVWVSDANGTRMGRAIGFDEHEAPLVPYIDRSVPPAAPDPAHRDYRALIGIRDDRFTSREPVYYTGLNCRGTPCVKAPSVERLDNRGVDQLPKTGAVSYFNALQGGPTYAIGRSPGALPGLLYRQSDQVCPAESILSRWVSQSVVLDEPCESPFAMASGIVQQPLVCEGSFNNPATCPQLSPAACSSLPGTGDAISGELCGCPAGWSGTPSGPAGLNINLCCPAGTQADSLGLTCVSNLQELFVAESVPLPDDFGKNALEDLFPPFQVNLPANGVNEWRTIAPDGEDGGSDRVHEF